MKALKIKPSNLSGKVRIPPSKSVSHRAIICASLSEGVSLIENISFSKDITATLEGMKAFGVEVKDIKKDENNLSTVTLKRNNALKVLANTIDCKESGSTLRFLIPMAGLVDKKITFLGEGKLVERPLDTYYKIFEKQEIEYKNKGGKLPLTVNGKLKSGSFYMRGDISSQFISGLLFVLPLLEGDSKIIITSPLESKGYVDITIDALKAFGVEVENKAYKEFKIKGNQKYKNRGYRVEGDFSQAAFWIVGALLGGNINCLDLNIHSLQGDKEILEIIKAMGGEIQVEEDFIKAYPSNTHGTIIDASQCPDLVPVLATLGALSKGTTKIVNAKRLRIKESDRLKAITTELNKLGADIEELEEGLVIRGKEYLTGGVVDSWNDHRIAMALGIASIKCKEEVILTGYESVSKSYPTFWRDFENLGGKIDEWHVG